VTVGGIAAIATAGYLGLKDLVNNAIKAYARSPIVDAPIPPFWQTLVLILILATVGIACVAGLLTIGLQMQQLVSRGTEIGVIRRASRRKR
jgi:hypothetical protein